MADLQTLLNREQFFLATVTNVDPATFAIELFPHNTRYLGVMQGIPLASSLANLLGFKDCSMPQVGACVLCFHFDAHTCLIIGIVPKPDALNKEANFHNRTVLGAGDSNNDDCNIQGYTDKAVAKIVTLNRNRPTDVSPGEHVVVNDFGVLLGLFQNFATLKASELAQVQAFVFDDLVRIVSHNFQHYTCMGETKVFQDGIQLNTEINLTHDSYEALGTPQVSSIGAESPIKHTGEISVDDVKNFYELKKENQIGIARLKLFLGSLGDFVRLLIVRPAEGELRALDGESIAEYDKGLADIKIGLNGEISARTLKGLTLEKSNWIRVPARTKAPEEPASIITSEDSLANREAAVKPLIAAREEFQFDNSALSQNQPYLYFLQLKDYLAYTQEMLGYKAFNDSGSFSTPVDRTQEIGLSDISSIHPDAPARYLDRKAGIHIMPNGGLVLMDAWGSSIVMEGGNIYLQSAKDVVMQPMRNLAGKVGNCVAVAVKGDIDLSSTEGNFRVKTDKAQHLYSANSGIILQSDSETIGEFAPKTGDSPITDVHGIILAARDSTIASTCQYRVEDINMIFDLRAKMEFHEVEKQYIMNCNGGLDIFSKSNILMATSGNLINFTEGMALTAGMTSTVVGTKDNVIGVSPFGAVHGLINSNDSQFQDFRARIEELINLDYTAELPLYSASSAFDDLTFRFPNSSNYKFAASEFFPQTIAQQEDAAFGSYQFKAWEEKEVNGTWPYPGIEMAKRYATSILNNLELDSEDDELYNAASPPQSSSSLKLDGDLFKEYLIYGN